MTSTATPGLLLVHAHPDDESITTGGTIARYAAAGVRVTLVTCTLGEEGEIVPPGLAQLGSDAADQLGGYRVAELREACAALGVAEHRFLGGIGRWRDSGMAGTATNKHPRALMGGDAGEQAATLRAVLDEVRPAVVISYASDGGYGHPDHVRAHEITVAATSGHPDVARVFHAVNSRDATGRGLASLAAGGSLPYRVPRASELPWVDDELIDTVLDISGQRHAKLAALRAHTTQISAWDGEGGSRPAGFALSNGLAQPIPDHEYFRLASGEPGGVADDLFGGLGVATGKGGYS